MKMILWILLLLSPLLLLVALTWRVRESVGEVVVVGHLYGPDQQPLGNRDEFGRQILVVADRGPFLLSVRDGELDRLVTTDGTTWASVGKGETVELWVDRIWLTGADRKLFVKRKP